MQVGFFPEHQQLQEPHSSAPQRLRQAGTQARILQRVKGREAWRAEQPGWYRAKSSREGAAF